MLLACRRKLRSGETREVQRNGEGYTPKHTHRERATNLCDVLYVTFQKLERGKDNASAHIPHRTLKEVDGCAKSTRGPQIVCLGTQ